MDKIDVDLYFQNLMDKAMADGVITEEERTMIRSISNQLDAYTDILQEAMEDGIISLKEKLSLYKFRTGMFHDNIQLVQEDDKVTQDEINLLNLLTGMLSNMGKFEDKHKSNNTL